jgi:hypothetical protein
VPKAKGQVDKQIDVMELDRRPHAKWDGMFEVQVWPDSTDFPHTTSQRRNTQAFAFVLSSLESRPLSEDLSAHRRSSALHSPQDDEKSDGNLFSGVLVNKHASELDRDFGDVCVCFSLTTTTRLRYTWLLFQSPSDTGSLLLAGNALRSGEDGVHSSVAASEAEGVQVLWYVDFLSLTHIYLSSVLDARFSRLRFDGYRTGLTRFVVAVDHSLLSRYVLKPYWWSQVINIFPMSMAPNAVSISCCVQLHFLLGMVY